VDPAQRLAKRNIGFSQHVVLPLGPGSRARTDIVRKIGAEARAWPGHETVAAQFLFIMSNSPASLVPATRLRARVLLVSFPSAP
jgi:hypothetical protein